MSDNLNQQNLNESSNTSNNAGDEQSNKEHSTNEEKIFINGYEYNIKDQQVERIELPNTDFIIVGSDELGWILTLGNIRLTEPKRTKDEILDYINEEPWKLTTNLIINLTNLVQNFSKIQNNNNK